MDVSYYKQFEPIDGKWYIKKELGRGAFGTVFEVERSDFSNMKAAMKVVSIPSVPGEIQSFRSENYDLDDKSVTSYFYGFVEEFIKEFQLMSQLKGHSNIVSYEDHNVIERKDEIGWDIFIRMELLTPMSDYFKDNAPTRAEVIKLGVDICRALSVCQTQQIIHRDIKPSNIFISASGDFKLGDFGVARTLEKTSGGLSKKGTYTYMAPEVFKGEPYSANVDTYSLGIVMYRLLNNNMEPFRTDRTYSDGERAMEMRITGKEMPAPANADKALAEVILKACSYNPGDRFETPDQMREALEKLQRQEKTEDNLCPEAQPESETLPEQREDRFEGTVGLFGAHGESVSAPQPAQPQTPAPQENGFDRTQSLFTSRESVPVKPTVNPAAASAARQAAAPQTPAPQESEFDRTQSLFTSRETVPVKPTVNPAAASAARQAAAPEVKPAEAPKATPAPVQKVAVQQAAKPKAAKKPNVPGKTLGLVSMILGFISIVGVCCTFVGLPFPIAGIITGIMALKQAKAAGIKNKQALVGIICSIIGLVLIVAYIIFVLVMSIIGSSTPSYEPGFTYYYE